ncbi:hypothetical protein C0989_009210 [Termitomyces sp. Mn162]|nr:hypothetical protein C0989_009210 [Termitomyces sp. Mn162]
MHNQSYYALPSHLVKVGVFALVTSVVLNSIGSVVQLRHKVRMPNHPDQYTWSHNDANSLPIDVRPVALEVVDSDHYGLHDSNDWASVFPRGHGFVKGGEDQQFYAISMYHQMHCLNSFRRLFNSVHPRNVSRSNSEHKTKHAMHCLAYLRQMVLCSADTTLEPAFAAQDTDGRKTQAAYGSGVTHQCRDWVQVREYAEGNYGLWEDEATDFVTSEISVAE